MKSPVAIICYNRVNCLKQMINALTKCNSYRDRKYYFFVDGPNYKKKSDDEKVGKVREYLESIKTEGVLPDMELFFSSENKGCRKSVIEALSYVLETNDRVIDIEDDLVMSEDFLDYMDEALDYYAADASVWSVTGSSENLTSVNGINETTYKIARFMSWGFGIWRDRWNMINWEKEDRYRDDITEMDRFSEIGYDLPNMLILQQEIGIDSWAITCAYNAFIYGMDTVAPAKSKVFHIGYGADSGIHITKDAVAQQMIELGASDYDFRCAKRHADIDDEIKDLVWNSEQYYACRDSGFISKYKEYYFLIARWMKYRENNIDLSRFFSLNGYNRIAIYGCGFFAERLLAEIKDTNVSVVCYMDGVEEEFCGEPVLRIGDPLPSLDAIIVTPFTDYIPIKKELKRYTDLPVISLTEIVK